MQNMLQVLSSHSVRLPITRYSVPCDVAAIVCWAAVHREATGNCDTKCGMELNSRREISIFVCVYKLIQLTWLELEAFNANTKVCYVTLAVWRMRIFNIVKNSFVSFFPFVVPPYRTPFALKGVFCAVTHLPSSFSLFCTLKHLW
jgi:hypothetical protein